MLCCCMEGEKRRGLDLEFGDCGDSEREVKVGDIDCGGAESAGRYIGEARKVKQGKKNV